MRKIIVAYDAGMGSSAMGAGVLRKKVQDAGLTNVSVTNTAINALPGDVDLVITHRDLTERAIRRAPHAQHISLNNFLDSALYSAWWPANRSEAQRETVETALSDRTATMKVMRICSDSAPTTCSSA